MRTEYNKRDEEREHMREIKEKQDKIKLFGKDSDSNVQSSTLYPSNNNKFKEKLSLKQKEIDRENQLMAHMAKEREI